MSIRSQWCEFDKETRKYIKKRDENKCIICGSKGALQIMHIFLPRSRGGKGCKENGCLGCVKCHQIMDNPIGTQQNELSKKYIYFCKQYLMRVENILDNYGNESYLIENLLKYKNKPIEIKSFVLNNTNIPREQKHCKNCVYLKKNKYNKSSINTYYCIKTRSIISKNNKICNMYEEGKNV